MFGDASELSEFAEELQIRRPDPRQPYGYDIRGTLTAHVQKARLQLDTDLNLNLTEERYNVYIIPAVPTQPVSSSDPNFEKDLQKDDHLIRLKFYADSEKDTEIKLKSLQGEVLQIVSQPEVVADVMQIEAVALGSL